MMRFFTYLVLFVAAVKGLELDEHPSSVLLRGGEGSRQGQSKRSLLSVFWWKCTDPCNNNCEEDEKCVTKKSPSIWLGLFPGCPVFDKCVPVKKEALTICPNILCARVECPCKEGQECITKQSTLTFDGKKCLGCPEFDRCEGGLYAIDMCPIPMCAPPECPCGKGETCKYTTNYFDSDGKKCPGCQVFDHCEPALPQTCGDSVCGDGLVCCNASCGICTPPGGFCTQQACLPVDGDKAN